MASRNRKRSQRATATEKYVSDWSERHAAAEETMKEIESMAFPTLPSHGGPSSVEVFSGEDPASLGGAMFTHHSPAMSEGQVRNKYDVPPLPASHGEGFGSSSRAKMSSDRSAQRHLGTWVDNMANAMGEGRSKEPDPLGRSVRHRRASLSEAMETGNPDNTWYQGKSQALIEHHALQEGVSNARMRQTVTGISPNMPWDTTYADNKANQKKGIAGKTTFPNVENAAKVTRVAEGSSSAEEAKKSVKSFVGDDGKKISGVRRAAATDISFDHKTGKRTGSDRLGTKKGEKTESFDLNNTDFVHPEYGYSPWVHRQSQRSHTGDLQDARAAGFHSSMVKPSANEGKDFHEKLLSTPAGADITQSTAMVANAEEFRERRAMHGEDWAKENAINFMPANAQSTQWSAARGTGAVPIPPDMEKAYWERRGMSGLEDVHAERMGRPRPSSRDK